MTASQQMMELIVRSWAARAAYSAVELGLPELLVTSGGQSRTVEHLGDLLGVAGLEVEQSTELPRGFVLLSCRAVPAG